MKKQLSLTEKAIRELKYDKAFLIGANSFITIILGALAILLVAGAMFLQSSVHPAVLIGMAVIIIVLIVLLWIELSPNENAERLQALQTRLSTMV